MEPLLERSSICSVAALFILLAVAPVLRGQETPPPPPEEAQEETQEPAEGKPKGAPGPPDGILPVGEIARLSFAPSDRPKLLLHGNRLVVTTTAGAVEGRDAASGEFRWKLGLPGETLFAPVVYRREPSEILLSSASGRLFVVGAETGEILRETELPEALALAPLVDSPRLYLGTPDGEVIAFDLEEGSERFRFQTGESPLALASSGGLLAASGSQHTLIGLSSDGGERFRLRGRSAFHAPAVFAQERLYIGDEAGDFYCLAVSNGHTDFRWSTGAAIRFAALVEDRLVFVTSFGNNLYAFQARGGTERFRVSLPGRPASGPVRFGRRLVVATYDGAIVEVDPQKAEVGKTYEAPGELASPPAFLPASPSPGTEWYASHRIALALRTGEVLLLGYRAGPEEEEEEKKPPKPPPPPTGTRREDSLSWK